MRKKSIVTLAAIAKLILISSDAASGSELKELGKISGKSLLAIQSAIPELAKYNLKVSNYTVSVTARDTWIFVTFVDPEQPPHVFGSIGPNPGFVVELTNDGATVIRSHFMR